MLSGLFLRLGGREAVLILRPRKRADTSNAGIDKRLTICNQIVSAIYREETKMKQKVRFNIHFTTFFVPFLRKKYGNSGKAMLYSDYTEIM